LPTFTDPEANGYLAPIPAVRATVIKPPSSSA
jgi:hypothetical protein